MSIKRSILGVSIRVCHLLVLIFLFSGIQAYAVDPEIPDSEEAISAGQSIFNANCKTCHRLDQKLVGPALRGVTDRRELDWAKQFITNSQVLVQGGDADAVALSKNSITRLCLLMIF